MKTAGLIALIVFADSVGDVLFNHGNETGG